MKKKLLCLVCVLVLVISSLTGCASGNTTKNTTENTPASTVSNTAASTTTTTNTANTSSTANTANTTADSGSASLERTLKLSKDPSEYKICIYWPAPDTYFQDNIQPGYQAIEKEYGIKIDYVIGTEWTQDVENQMVEAKAAEGYNLFLIYGADTSGANALYKELTSNGCTVINYGGVMDDPQESSFTVCGDVYDYSYNATKKMIEAIGEKGTIIDVLENLGDVNTLQRQKGVEAAVKEYPNVSICQTVGDIDTEDQGYEKVSNALAANPDASGIIATGGTASRGLANALEDYYSSNKSANHIYAVATDPSDEVLKGIKDGTIDVGIAQNGFGQGYLGALGMLYLTNGWKIKDPGVHIVTGYVFITTDNLTSYSSDIEALTKKIAGEFETKYFEKE